MTNQEYITKLEQILADYMSIDDTELGEDKFVGHHDPAEAITAILALNNEAMPQKKDATVRNGKDYFYSPEVKIAVANYNQAIDELRAVIGEISE